MSRALLLTTITACASQSDYLKRYVSARQHILKKRVTLKVCITIRKTSYGKRNDVKDNMIDIWALYSNILSI